MAKINNSLLEKDTGCLANRENLKDLSLSELIKYFASNAYFKAHIWYAKQMSYLTRYFPFSLLGQNMSYHHQNREFRLLMQQLVYSAQSLGLKFRATSCSKDQFFYHIVGSFDTKVNINSGQMVLNVLEKRLKIAQGSLYWRKAPNDCVRFIIPLELATSPHNP